MDIKKNGSYGVKIITLYFFVTYFMPMVGNSLFQDHIVSIRKIAPLTWRSVVLCLFVYGAYVLIEKKIVFNLRPVFLDKILGACQAAYSKQRLALAVFFLVISCLNFFKGFTSYRYQSMGISDQHSLILILGILCQQLIFWDLFYRMFCSGRKKIQTKQYIENMLFGVSLCLLAGGIGDLFFAFNACVFCFAPHFFQQTFFKKNDTLRKQFTPTIMGLIVIAVSFFSAYYFGSLIKIMSKHVSPVVSMQLYHDELTRDLKKIEQQSQTQQSAKVLTQQTQQVQQAEAQQVGKQSKPAQAHHDYLDKLMIKINAVHHWICYGLVERLSIFYYSLLYTVETPRDALLTDVTPIMLPLKTALFRVNYVFGKVFSLDKPELVSISQLNYRRLLADVSKYHQREGSSPGLLASFNYIFWFKRLNIFRRRICIRC